MSSQLAGTGRKLAYKAVMLQLTVVVAATIVAGFWGMQVASSVLVGGLVSIIPNAIMSYKAFQHSGAQAARKVLRAFYFGEAIKFLLTIVLFAIVFKWIPVVGIACLIGFVLAVFAQLLAPIVVKTT